MRPLLKRIDGIKHPSMEIKFWDSVFDIISNEFLMYGSAKRLMLISSNAKRLCSDDFCSANYESNATKLRHLVWNLVKNLQDYQTFTDRFTATKRSLEKVYPVLSITGVERFPLRKSVMVLLNEVLTCYQILRKNFLKAQRKRSCERKIFFSFSNKKYVCESKLDIFGDCLIILLIRLNWKFLNYWISVGF